VYEVTMERDALRKFLSDVRDVLAYEAKNSEALKMITDLVNERKVADES
jgi:predicted metal-dependent enzyme (double-stranded beta helix superfamily)